MQTTAKVAITDRAKKRLKGKHPWVFSNELESKPEGLSPGEMVEVHDREGRFLAAGYYNPHTLIAVRIVSFLHQPLPFDITDRIRKAFEFRKARYTEDVYRLVYGESDSLPGLIVDRYRQTLVAQVLTAGMERRKEEIVQALVETVAPARILLKNDSPYRALEGLPAEVSWAHGDPIDREVIEIDGVKLLLDYAGGQKTGFFLDQQDNRRALARYAHGDRMLDVFSYTGGWAIYAGKAGMTAVTVVDSSADALTFARRNAELNGLSLETVEADAFEFLRGKYAAPERYDVIVVDPPAFAKSRRQLPQALRGYREINLRAMKLLNKKGILITCSCSQPVTPDDFVEVLRIAAADSGRPFFLRELRLQPPDHPVLLQFPESLYLKCAILEESGR